ncbi:MAG: type VI secretion system protein TssA [Desulfobacula sp.]|nr:type VI secretion system protein TssA [Desulfobacula sp.]
MMMNLGKTPISEEAPAGKDVRYEADFESLSREIAKLTSPSADSGINWDTVINLSVKILEKDSKHLQAATYLNYGLIKTRGLEGLCLGIHIIKELMENFWETLFPPKNRMKGRKGILVWWEEKVSDFLSGLEPRVMEKEKRNTLLDELTYIDQFLGNHMEEAPLLLPLIKRVKEVVLEERIAEPPTAPAASLPKEQPAAAPVKPQKTIIEPLPVSDADTPALLGQGLKILAKAASGLRKENEFQPLAYRLTRIAAWTDIDTLPAATGGKTLIPPPEDQVITSLARLYDAGDWEALVDSSEGRVQQFLFWLDLSRYSAQGMERMGHPEVARVIEAETAFFVQTLKGIETLAFSDGTPFADKATLDWLRQTGSRDQAEPVDTGQAAGIHGILAQKMDLAQELIRQKQLDAALSLFRDHLSTAASEQNRFLWKTGLCRLLIDSDQVRIASSYMDDILETIDRFKLDLWEPESAVNGLLLVLRGLRLQKNDRNQDLIESVINRISRLDPVKALQMI